MSTSRVVVTRPDAIELLFNIRASRMLSAFVGTEQTLSSASVLLGVTPSSLAYWLPKLLDAGLLVEIRTEPRRGAAMRWYRTQGTQLFVPFALVPPATRTRFLESGRRSTSERLIEVIEERLSEDASAGFTFTSPDGTAIDIDLHPDPASGNDPWTAYSGTLRLTPARARALIHDIAALLDEHRRHEGGTSEVVISLGAAVAPSRRRRRRRTT